MLFALLFGICLGAIEVLKAEDLRDPSQFLVFLYYERPGFRCPACTYFSDCLDDIAIPVKKLNFVDDIGLGSRFMQYKFPAIILRDDLRSFFIDTDNKTSDEVVEIVNNLSFEEMRPVKPYLEVDAFLVNVFAAINPWIFKVMFFLYYIMDFLPSYVVSAFFIIVIAYLIYSIAEILMEPDVKPKSE